METKILVSACLLGEKVRYNGTGTESIHPILQEWQWKNRLVAVCPEVSGEMPIPRPPSEIQGIGAGLAVINRQAHVFDVNGQDVTDPFVLDAEKAFELVKQYNIKMAVMKARSPSCGRRIIFWVVLTLFEFFSKRFFYFFSQK